MKIYMFCYRDKKLQCFYPPLFQSEDKEHVVDQTIRSLKCQVDASQIANLKDKSFYYVGVFDDLDCKFDLLNEPEKLLDCEDYLCQPQA